MKLTKKEEAWLERFEKTMAAAPNSIGNKVAFFIAGDWNLTVYDFKKCNQYNDLNSSLNSHMVLSEAVTDSNSVVLEVVSALRLDHEL